MPPESWPDLLVLLSLAPDVVAAARCGPPDLVDTSPFAEERDAVARAVPSRQAEFLTGRHLARLALADLGVAAGPIARRDDRAPIWPAGVIGSITHTAGICAAVVVRPDSDATGLVGLGVDAEQDQVLDARVVDRVLTADEQTALGDRLAVDAVVAFSAKEALFKALHPATAVWLEPREVEVHLEPAPIEDWPAGATSGGTVALVSWAADVPGHGVEDAVGRWCRFGPWVVTAFTLFRREPHGARAGAVLVEALTEPRS